MTRTISVPDLCLVVLIGASGSGKSHFGRQHFLPFEVISSDYCRGLVSNDENSQTASKEAFELLHHIVRMRLQTGLLTVVDATNVQQEARAALVALAREHHVLSAAIVLDMPEALCHARNALRPDRAFGPHVVHRHCQLLRRSLRHLKDEGFRYVSVLRGEADVSEVTVERQPLWTNKKHEHGPFAIIGDVHGCATELETLLAQLAFAPDAAGVWRHSTGRKAIFVGDLVDRGPRVVDTLRLAMGMVAAGTALCVPGNHDVKLLRKLNGKQVTVAHGLAATLAELDGETPEFVAEVKTFIDALVGHYVLDDGKLVVAHAGMKQQFQGRSSGAVRSFALYGETTGETDDFGLPVRFNWAKEYRGPATVVYGHTPVPEPEWLNRTINVDTGCVFGGKLTALLYPEMETVSVPAREVYAEPARPFLPDAASSQAEVAARLTAQQQDDDMLDLADVTGQRFVETRLGGPVSVRAENAAAALEVMSRFAVDPRWLIYLPPTMSPSETTREPGLLEHPREAFGYYADGGVDRVICQEKHMGSRAVVTVCRDAAAARRRFGVAGDEFGIIVTRTGRRFFADSAMEMALLERVRDASLAAGLFEELATDWLCLDCELMPWSAKARELLLRQYAPVGAAAKGSLRAAEAALRQLAARQAAEVSGEGLGAATRLADNFAGRAAMAHLYREAYRRYCWDVDSIAEIKLAPFHLLASEGKVHTDQNHLWHMEQLSKLCAAGDNTLLPTRYLMVDLGDEASIQAGIRWWEELTAAGGEGMVVKPLDFIATAIKARGARGLLQPAVKCRGREYLRIIYGPEYTAPGHLERLRSRGLGAKRSLALREFALGIEALERFVRHEPLRGVHECVFGVLALESEPVDPRL